MQLGQWLPATLVGLGAWWWLWRAVSERRRSDPVDEANSTIRRSFLFLTLGVALIAAITAAALILYRLTSTVLDAGIGGNPVSELSTPFGVLVAAGVILAYHGLALRADQKLAKPADAAEVADTSSRIRTGGRRDARCRRRRRAPRIRASWVPQPISTLP